MTFVEVGGAVHNDEELLLNALAVLGVFGEAFEAKAHAFCLAGFRCVLIVTLCQTVITVKVATATAQ